MACRNRAALARRNLPLVGPQERVGEDRDAMVEAVPHDVALKMDIGMRAQRQGRGLAASRLERMPQLDSSEAVSRSLFDLAGKVLVAIGAQQPQGHRGGGGDFRRLEFSVEADSTSVERGAGLVPREHEGLPSMTTRPPAMRLAVQPSWAPNDPLAAAYPTASGSYRPCRSRASSETSAPP